MIVLDQQGQVVAGPHELDPAVGGGPRTFIPTHDAGFAVLWGRRRETDPAAAQELFFTKLGADGEVEVAAQPVANLPAPSEDMGRLAATLLYPVDDGYLALWTERQGDKGVFGAPVGYSVIWTRLLGPGGEARSAAAPLNAREEDVDERSPALVRVGDLLGLFWVRGRWTVDCEWMDACPFRDSGRFVLLDPHDLTPRSEVIEIARDPSYPSYWSGGASPELNRLGGIEESELLPAGDGVLVTATLLGQDSKPTDVGFGKIACD